MTHVDEVLVCAANYVVIGDGDGVNTAPRGLKDMDTLKRTNVPNLREMDRKSKQQKDYLRCRNKECGAVSNSKHVELNYPELMPLVHIGYIKTCHYIFF